MLAYLILTSSPEACWNPAWFPTGSSNSLFAQLKIKRSYDELVRQVLVYFIASLMYSSSFPYRASLNI